MEQFTREVEAISIGVVFRLHLGKATAALICLLVADGTRHLWRLLSAISAVIL